MLGSESDPIKEESIPQLYKNRNHCGKWMNSTITHKDK